MLGLVVTALVLWNTIYMQAALNHLQAGGSAGARGEHCQILAPPVQQFQFPRSLFVPLTSRGRQRQPAAVA